MSKTPITKDEIKARLYELENEMRELSAQYLKAPISVDRDRYKQLLESWADDWYLISNDFFKGLQAFYKKNGFLTPKQIGALERLIIRVQDKKFKNAVRASYRKGGCSGESGDAQGDRDWASFESGGLNE